MNVPLLKTKLYIPKSQPNLVSRPGLLAYLNEGMDGKLTLVSAPAGFGKSTLLVEWIQKGKLPFGWITLDENDNDLGRFLAYFINCLGTLHISVDPQLPSLPRSTGDTNLEGITIPIINQITNSNQRFGLVLDDYHLIQSEEIHNTLAYLLDYLPPNMHLVIASRSDPPLNLAKLRANGQMNEVRASHLRFTLGDADHLLNQIRGFDLTSEDLEYLITRTDGWIAGLQMVSIALEGKSDPAQYIRDFSGNQEYIADYLTTEVFNQQPGSVQDFLLKTSILDRLCAPLCDALTGQRESKQILKYLKDRNLFLMNQDDHGRWYRYHRLFADLINQRLIETQPESVPSLYRKASDWFDANGFITEAIDYAFLGGSPERAASLIEKGAVSTLIRSEIATFIRWMEKLPDEVIYKKGSLCIYYAWALLVSAGEHQKAALYLNKVVLRNEGIKGRANAVKAMLAVFQRDIDEAIRLAQEALRQLPDDDHFFRHIAAWNLSACLFISGDKEGGAKMLQEVARVSLASNNQLVAIITLCRLGSYHFQQGDLDQASSLFEQAIEVKPDQQDQPLPAACEAMLGLGKVHWERYELETASQYLYDGIQLSKRWRESTDIDSYITLAHLSQSQGNNDLALQYINTAKNMAAQNATTERDDKFVSSQEALIYLRRGNLLAVERWASKLGLEEFVQGKSIDEIGNRGADIILMYELIVYARYLLVDRKVNKSLELLGKLLPSLERLGLRSKIFESKILISLSLHAIGKIDEMVSKLTSVLADAENAGFKRIFLDEGQGVASLIETCIARGYDTKFTREILDLFYENNSDELPMDDAKSIMDSLSDREIEVLRFLDSELPVSEIADCLYIAVSTLRTHLRNIYSKLGVHSRFEAVSRGKDQKII